MIIVDILEIMKFRSPLLMPLSMQSLRNESEKDGIQIQVFNIINESVNHSSQFISVTVKKNLRKYQTQFREKLRKLRLRQNERFSYKKKCN